MSPVLDMGTKFHMGPRLLHSGMDTSISAIGNVEKTPPQIAAILQFDGLRVIRRWAWG